MVFVLIQIHTYTGFGIEEMPQVILGHIRQIIINAANVIVYQSVLQIDIGVPAALAVIQGSIDIELVFLASAVVPVPSYQW